TDGRPQPRGRTLRAARAKPLAARLGFGTEPRLGGGAPAWRRAEAGGQPPGPADCACLTARRSGECVLRRPGSGRRKKPGIAPAWPARRMAGALPRGARGGGAKVAEWLAGTGRTASGETLSALLGAHPPLAQVLGGIAASAPYLWHLAQADPE